MPCSVSRENAEHRCDLLTNSVFASSSRVGARPSSIIRLMRACASRTLEISPRGTNCEPSPQSPIIPVLPSTPPYRQVGICGNNWAVSPDKHAKRKPPNQRVRRPLFPLFRWWLCSMAMPKQHQAVLGGTKMRVQKPVSAIPTLSRSFVVAPFRLGLVWLSVLSTLPPNPSACPRVSVWDKPWDKFANYFETASPQFHFCPGDKNGLVLRP